MAALLRRVRASMHTTSSMSASGIQWQTCRQWWWRWWPGMCGSTVPATPCRREGGLQLPHCAKPCGNPRAVFPAVSRCAGRTHGACRPRRSFPRAAVVVHCIRDRVPCTVAVAAAWDSTAAACQTRSGGGFQIPVCCPLPPTPLPPLLCVLCAGGVDCHVVRESLVLGGTCQRVCRGWFVVRP